MPAASLDQANESLYAAVGPSLKDSSSLSLSEIRTQYLHWATNLVLNELAAEGQKIPDEAVAELMGNSIIRDGVFRSVYPPDPSILQGYLRLRSELAANDAKRFQSLILAFAVAKRIHGVEENTHADYELDLTEKFSKEEKNGKDRLGNYQAAFWGDEDYLKPLKGKDKELVAAITEFIQTSRVTPLELYNDTAQQAKLIQFLNDRKINPSLVGKVKPSPAFGELLKHSMVELGQRPETRSQKPNTLDWFHYLLSIYQATPASLPVMDGKPMHWPLFPLEQAPWPLLMPLARPVPLDEARYMWETFQGEHGADRYHTYGPYRDDAKAMPYELEPSPWFWAALPDRIVHGGECVPISIGTVDLYSSLAKPAVWAGQPGHANLISYQRDQYRWSAKVEQAFAGGPDVTHAQWYFDDLKGTELRFRDLYNWAGAEYHLGLALAMNQDLESYFDTRMAANIFGALPTTERETTGRSLLIQANYANPFNPNLWYQLAKMATNAAQQKELLQKLLTYKPATQSDYWKTVDQFVVQYAVFDQPLPAQRTDLIALRAMLGKIPGLKPDQLKTYAARSN